MQIDNISFSDISIFHAEEEFSIFHKLNFTRTSGGKAWLRKFFTEPHGDLKRIMGTQKVIRSLMEHVDDWPEDISNGTLLVMDKFMDYALDPISERSNVVNGLVYKWLHSEDYSMVKYSIPHFADFFRGIRSIAMLLDDLDLPPNISIYIDRIAQVLKDEPLGLLSQTEKGDKFSIRDTLYFGYYLRTKYRTKTLELID
ncbi:MAG TPA: DNA mismatch repair protein MutS, partial [Chitinophagaceae bacterium]|nr:DNA mismatch repair protein MutS [Chitinophagaceae bacterium]